MFSSKGSRKAVLFSAIFFLMHSPAFCKPKGFVGVGIQWGQTRRGTYTFVFAGQVTREGRPCPHARINLDLETSTQGVISESAQAGEDGQYQIAVTVAGAPEQSSIWKLQARAGSLTDRQTGQIEGRIILMEDQTTVVVSKSIPLEQA